MNVAIVGAVAVAFSLAVSGCVCWVAQRVTTRRRHPPAPWHESGDPAGRRRFWRGLRGWLEAGVRALALAGCPSAALYVPTETQVSGRPRVGEHAVVLPGSQLVLVSIEGDTLVLDCLIPGDPDVHSDVHSSQLQVPFTLRARRSHRPWTDIVPAVMQEWIDSGTSTDIVITQKGRAPIALLSASGSQISLHLQSVGVSHGSSKHGS